MARERISEYKAKKMILGDAYLGMSLSSSTDSLLNTIPFEACVVKVDQGVKKRFVQGLVAVNVAPKDVSEIIKKWEGLGYSKFLLEEYVHHDATEERYLSFERVRDGIRVLWVEEGGIDVESVSGSINSFLLSDNASINVLIAKGIPQSFLDRVQTLIMDEYVSFIEINPIIITLHGPILLDAAVLVDGAGAFFARAWNVNDIILPPSKYPEEATVVTLQRSTAASLKLNVINPDGSLFFLLSGGGGSIVILDAVHERGLGKSIGNFGEYSGGPTREETYLYTKQVLSCMLRSKSPRKALVIAGGVANFTDVLQTFQGVIDAISEVAPEMRDANILVFVRRGGPNESAGLLAMETFLKKEGLYGAVYGSDVIITQAVMDAIEEVK